MKITIMGSGAVVASDRRGEMFEDRVTLDFYGSYPGVDPLDYGSRIGAVWSREGLPVSVTGSLVKRDGTRGAREGWLHRKAEPAEAEALIARFAEAVESSRQSARRAYEERLAALDLELASFNAATAAYYGES